MISRACRFCSVCVCWFACDPPLPSVLLLQMDRHEHGVKPRREESKARRVSRCSHGRASQLPSDSVSDPADRDLSRRRGSGACPVVTWHAGPTCRFILLGTAAPPPPHSQPPARQASPSACRSTDQWINHHKHRFACNQTISPASTRITTKRKRYHMVL
jgi:hypothetical protein